MKYIAKYSLSGAFVIAAAAGLMQMVENNNSPVLPENIICTSDGIKTLKADGTLSTVLSPEAKANVKSALAITTLGEIGFASGGATVILNDEARTTSHEALFIFIGKGLICYDNDNLNCATMNDLTPEQKSSLTDTLCERAKGRSVEFQQKFCSLKP